MMRVTGLDHVSVTVGDLERSLAFYHNLLRIPLIGTGEETSAAGATIVGFPGARVRYADLDLGSGQILELLQYLAPTGSPLTTWRRRALHSRRTSGIRAAATLPCASTILRRCSGTWYKQACRPARSPLRSPGRKRGEEPAASTSAIPMASRWN